MSVFLVVCFLAVSARLTSTQAFAVFTLCLHIGALGGQVLGIQTQVLRIA